MYVYILYYISIMLQYLPQRISFGYLKQINYVSKLKIDVI